MKRMRTNPFWECGDQIVLRGVWRQKLWWAMPVIVVEDTADLIALYWPEGTPNKIPASRLAPRDLFSTKPIDLVNRKWVNTDVLMLTMPGNAHAVYVMWEDGHKRLKNWYIDLQEALRRTSIGFDTHDQLLDIVVSPDLSEWKWKDEDEFREAIEIGVFSGEEAEAIRAEGERVIKQMQGGLLPYREGWEKWEPPKAWKIPEFPPDWDRIIE